MIKAIFFDIDGTLISKQNPRFTNALKECLAALRAKGILLFIATGRHRLEIEELGIAQDFTFDGYLTLNGCYCYNTKETIYKASIDTQDVKSILTLLDETKTACMFVEAKDMYINHINQRVIEAQAAIHTPVPEVQPVKRALQNDIFQIIPYITDQEAVPFLQVTKNCKGTRWHPLAYDIIPNTGGKEAGIKAILEYYGISQKESMAFGDGHNDIGMLTYVGVGVAMGNADETVKRSSDYVTLSVDEQGIQHALKHYQILS